VIQPFRHENKKEGRYRVPLSKATGVVEGRDRRAVEKNRDNQGG